MDWKYRLISQLASVVTMHRILKKFVLSTVILDTGDLPFELYTKFAKTLAVEQGLKLIQQGLQE